MVLHAPLRAVLFDAGGTLVYLDAERITRRLADSCGSAHAADDFVRAQCTATAALFDGGPPQPLHETLFRHLGVPAAHIDASAAWLREWLAAELLWVRPASGALALLEGLKARGYQVGAISNSDGRAAAGLEVAGLASHLEFVIDSHHVGVEKPDPEIFRLGLRAAGVSPEEAVYVGDIPSIDVIGARAVGLQPVLHDPFDLFPDVDCVRIKSLGELLEVLP